MSEIQCTEFLKNDNMLSNLKKPNDFTDRLKTTTEKTGPILKDFSPAYVAVNTYPETQDYQQTFANVQSNITQNRSDLFTISNNVQSATDIINTQLLCLNKMITEEKDKNQTLKRRLGLVEEKSNASSELIDDYRNIYEEGYLRNWGLVLSVMIIFFAVKNMYGNINGDMNSSVRNMGSSVYNNARNMGSNMYNNARNMGSNVYKKYAY